MSGITGYRLSAEINRQLKLSNDIARLQSDISTGNRLQKASDDPGSWAQVSVLRRTQANQEAWLGNTDTASSVADQMMSVLDGLGTSYQRAAELVIQANGATSTASDRAAIADELLGIAEDIDSAATTVDARGLPIFPDEEPLPIPISRVLQIKATDSKTNVFDTVQTPGGTGSLAQILRDAAAAITNPDDTARKAASAVSNDAVQAGIEHIAALQGQQGVRAARIDTVREQLLDNADAIEERRGNLEGTDVAATVAQLQANLLSLQAAQSTFARINQTSLFDLLR